jgi:hypothetical protein
MSKFVRTESQTNGLRVECPCSESCEYAIPKSEWSFQLITDHYCPNGHCFRIEGTDEDSLVMFEIDPKLTTKKSLV